MHSKYCAALTLIAPLTFTLLLTAPAARATPGNPSPSATILSLNVSGQATHAPDAMTASLLLQAQKAERGAAQSALNRQAATILRQLHRIAHLQVTTGYYAVNATQHGHLWQASQSITLTFNAAPNSQAAKPVLALIGQLQAKGVALQSLAGTLQPATRAATRDAAIRAAVARLHHQETALATALGLRVGHVRSISMNLGGLVMPMFHPMMLAAAAAAPPPMVQPGPVSERVDLAATIALHPAR